MFMYVIYIDVGYYFLSSGGLLSYKVVPSTWLLPT